MKALTTDSAAGSRACRWVVTWVLVFSGCQENSYYLLLGAPKSIFSREHENVVSALPAYRKSTVLNMA